MRLEVYAQSLHTKSKNKKNTRIGAVILNKTNEKRTRLEMYRRMGSLELTVVETVLLTVMNLADEAMPRGILISTCLHSLLHG